jgi:class 3 adenylate cyclase
MGLCPACRARLPQGARFCPACGAAGGEALPAGEEWKVVTVLFGDLSGSTELGERLDAETLRIVLGEYFEAMAAEIEAEGGTREKFIGDAVMAVFGAPVAHEDDPVRAVRAALAMQARLAQLNERLAERHDVTLALRVGVNTGEVVAADSLSAEFLVAGDAVNVAARLEGAARPGEVLVGKRTARALRGRFSLTERGSLDLKGKSAAIPAWIVEPGEAADVDEGLGGPFVGRREEIRALREAYAGTLAIGSARLVTVLGEPGVGKSRLVREFLTWAAGSSGARLYRGRCPPGGHGTAFGPLGQLLKAESGSLDSDEPGDALRKLAAHLEDVLPATVPHAARVRAALAFTMGLEVADSPLRGLGSAGVRFELLAAWRAYLGALGAQGGAVVLVEDVHWADASLLDLLEHLAERVRAPVLVLCTARPDLAGTRPDWGGERIALEPLSPEESSELVLGLVPEGLPERLRAEILARAEGNPLFVEQIIEQLGDTGTLVGPGSGSTPPPEAGPITIPDTVQAVLAARIDLLGAREKRAIQSTAAVGRIFWAAPLARLDPAGGEVGAVLEALERRKLVVRRPSSSFEGASEYAFKHVLVRDVAYAGLTRRRRAHAHAGVAAWLEEAAGERRRELADTLAHHLGQAYEAGEDSLEPVIREGLRRRALAQYRLASERAAARAASEETVAHARHALALAVDGAERAHALETLAGALLVSGGADEAWDVLREEVAVRETLGDPRALAAACVRAVEVPTRWMGAFHALIPEDETERIFQLGRGAAEESSPEHARLLAARSYWLWCFYRERDPPPELAEAVVAAGREASELARAQDDAALESAALDGLQMAFVRLGRMREAEDATERRRATAAQIGDPRELGDIYGDCSWIFLLVGRYRAAADDAERGARLARGLAPEHETNSLSWLALARYRLGEVEATLEAHERIEQLLAEDRRQVPPPYAVRQLGTVARIHLLRGNEEAADRAIELARAVDRSLRRPALELYPYLAWALLSRGKADEARALLEPHLAQAALLPAPGLIEAYCDTLAELEDWAAVPGQAGRARRLAEERGLVTLPPYARRLEGRAALAAGNAERARRALAEAARAFEEREARWEEALTRLDLARALDGEEAAAERARAEELLP